MPPLYLEIVDDLLARRKQITQPERLSDEMAMAERYKVGRDTIRRSLQLLEKRGVVTRQRKRGTFLYPSKPRIENIAGRTVGFVPPWWADSTTSFFTSAVFEGVSRWAEEHDCRISVFHTVQDPENPEAWVKQLHERDLAGLVWVHPQMQHMPLIELAAKIAPNAILGRQSPGNSLHSVLPDYAEAAALIDEHLMSLGHSSYVVVGRGAMEPYTADWIKAFEAAYSARGAKFAYRRHFLDLSSLSAQMLGELLMSAYQPNYPDNQAVVLLSSSYLSGLVRHESFRREAEQRLSLVAFDFGLQPVDSYWPGLPMTHIACDWAEMGRHAIAVVAQLASGADVPRLRIDPVELKIGASTRPRLPINSIQS